LTLDVFLETDRLILRWFTPDDVDNLTALDSDPAVMERITGGRPTPREEIACEYLPAFLAYHERPDGYGFWAAIEKDRRPGLVHLRRTPAPADEPSSLPLRASAWGRGCDRRPAGPCARFELGDAPTPRR
jgi:hypothetical protein